MPLHSSIDFVLVRPQYAGNVGAVARALKNTAFKNLILVQPSFSKDDLDLKRYAMGGFDLIKKAKIYNDLSTALKKYTFVIGTSRRKGAYRRNFITLFELPKLIESLRGVRRIALLFGTEMSGLSNEELSFCQHIVYIPVNSRFESLNLAQAVLLVAYELFRFRTKLPSLIKDLPSPTTAQLEGMYEHLTQMLSEIGFVKNRDHQHIPSILRNILGRAHLTLPESQLIRGICRQVLWYKDQQKRRG